MIGLGLSLRNVAVLRTITDVVVQPITAAEPADRGRLSGYNVAEESRNTVLTLNPRVSQDYENRGALGLRSQVVFTRISGVQGVENLRIRIALPPSGLIGSDESCWGFRVAL